VAYRRRSDVLPGVIERRGAVPGIRGSHLGHTLVHFQLTLPAQRKRFLWDRGCAWGLFRGCLRGVRGRKGVLRVSSGYVVLLETAQVELGGGRVYAPARHLSAAGR